MSRSKFLAVMSVGLVLLLALTFIVYNDKNSTAEKEEEEKKTKEPHPLDSSQKYQPQAEDAAFKPDVPAVDPDVRQVANGGDNDDEAGSVAKAKTEMLSKVNYVRSLVPSVKRRTVITTILVITFASLSIVGIVLINRWIVARQLDRAFQQAVKDSRNTSASQKFGQSVYDYLVPPEKDWLDTTTELVGNVYFLVALFGSLVIIVALLLSVATYWKTISKSLKGVGKMFKPVTKFLHKFVWKPLQRLWRWIASQALRPFSGLVPI